MINEFMQLAKAIPSGGTEHAAQEDKLTSLPNGETVRVLLAADGTISDIEVLDKERSASLRKYMPNKFKAFPGFNQLLVPTIDTWRARIEEAQSLPMAQREELFKRLGVKDSVPDAEEQLYGAKGLYKKAVKGSRSNLIDFPKELASKIGPLLDENETLSRLLNALAKIEDEKSFLVSLEKVCYEKSVKYDLAKPVSFFFDVDGYEEWPMAHRRTLERLNEVLCKSEDAAIAVQEDSSAATTDAFGGACAGSDALMRDISIPHFAMIKMRSSNKDVEALSRYHVTGSEGFPMGKSARIEAEAALRYVINPDGDGFTYGRVSSNEILIAYPTDMAMRQKTPLVRMFGGGSDPECERLVFRKVAQNVIELLKGEGKDLPNRELRIFSIRKMDKARTKVVYYRNIDVTALAMASEEWNEGCHNLPTLDVKDWPTVSKGEKRSEKDKKPHSVEMETVFPARLYCYLSKYYKRDFISEDLAVSRFEPSTGMELMLMNGCEVVPFAQNILSQVMLQAGNYYRALCVSLGQSKVASAKDKGLHLGILGLLLYKVGKRKENYMNETAFLLGKFLRIADGLHRCYCDSERKGQYPGEFCGSSLLSAMMENPIVALAQFGQRSAPYVKWAQACQKKECAGLAHWWLNQWQPIADALYATKLPMRLTDAERAELFLGYLSSLPKKENLQDSNDDFETENNKSVKENN